MKKAQYKVMVAPVWNELEIMVTKKLNLGWKCAGGIMHQRLERIADDQGRRVEYFYQAIVKEKNG